MQWGSRRRFAVIGGGSLIAGLMILSMGAYIASSTYTYYVLAYVMMALSLVLLSTGVVVLVAGGLRAS